MTTLAAAPQRRATRRLGWLAAMLLAATLNLSTAGLVGASSALGAPTVPATPLDTTSDDQEPRSTRSTSIVAGIAAIVIIAAGGLLFRWLANRDAEPLPRSPSVEAEQPSTEPDPHP